MLRTDPLGQENLTAPSCRSLLPSDLKSAWWLGKLDNQSVRLDLNARDVSMDETAVVDRLRGLEMVTNRFDDQHLDLTGRHAAH